MPAGIGWQWYSVPVVVADFTLSGGGRHEQVVAVDPHPSSWSLISPYSLISRKN